MDPAASTRLGRSDITVTRVGLGTAPLGNLYDAVTDEVAQATIRSAYTRGLRLFDTAPLYGHGLAEQRLGAALAELPGEVVLATKVGRLLRETPAGGEAAAVQFPFGHPAVTSVVIGARSAAEIGENAEMAAWPVPGELWAELRDEGLLPSDVPLPA